LASAIFGSVNLDIDERAFVVEPYQMVGGDYTRGYLAAGDAAGAARCALKSYFFYWYYRPLFAPVIEDRHRTLFSAEEERFGYVRPEDVRERSEVKLDRYENWLVVPEPDRWYRHGAGKPLLPAVLTLPSLGLVELATRGGPTLLEYQFGRNYHPIFLLVRLSQIIAGLVSVVLVYRALRGEHGERKAVLGSAIFALFPLAIQWFPNLHHDAIMVPFAVAATTNFLKSRYARSGIFFGLALASKNVAFLLLPALLLMVLWNLLRVRRSDDPGAFCLQARRLSRGVPVFLLLALVALVPFANPVSYAKEVLTPFTAREYDPRGEDVSRFTVSGRLLDPHDSEQVGSVRRSEVMLLDRVSVLDATLFLMILAILLAATGVHGDLARFSFIMLLLMVPYQLVFGQSLSWRYLLFLPFFVFLLSRLVDARRMRWVLAFVVLVDIILLIDPMTTSILHVPAGAETFWGALFGAGG
jgi:hypothetical protein